MTTPRRNQPKKTGRPVRRSGTDLGGVADTVTDIVTSVTDTSTSTSSSSSPSCDTSSSSPSVDCGGGM